MLIYGIRCGIMELFNLRSKHMNNDIENNLRI